MELVQESVPQSGLAWEEELVVMFVVLVLALVLALVQLHVSVLM